MKRISIDKRISQIIHDAHLSGEHLWIEIAAREIKKIVSYNYRRRQR
jgi:hypothetical protein